MPNFEHEKMFERIGVQLTSLKPLKKLKSERFYTFDTETKDGLIAKYLYCYSFCQYSHKSFQKTFTQIEDLTDLFIRLKELQTKKRYTIVYIHNLDFDIRFIINYCIQNNIPYHPILSGSSFIACIIQSIRVKFIDTIQFLKCSQEEAEITYKIPSEYIKIDCKDLFEKKYELWTKKDKKRVIDHNHNDVIALHLIVQQIRQNLYDICNVDFLTILTPASLCMKAFRKTLKTPIKNPFVYQIFDAELNRIVYQYDKEKYEFVKRSYFGGRTEVFNTHFHRNITVFDKVSMYPTMMKFKKFPCGYGINYANNQNDCKEMMYMIQSIGKYAQYEGFIECKITFPNNIKYPLLAEHRNNKLMFTNCTKHNVFTLPELRFLYNQLKDNKDFSITVFNGFIFHESKNYFADYIDKMFPIKQNNEGSKKDLAKLLMNGLYGKFGQVFERKESKFHVFTTLEESLIFSDTLEKDSFETKKQNDLFLVIEKSTSTSIKAFMNVCIASYITAYARIDLTQQLQYCEQQNIDVLYCDTDSFAIESKYENLIQNQGKNLGNWSIDKQMLQVQFLAPKCYIYQDKKTNEFKLKLKGIESTKIKTILKECQTFEEISNKIHASIHLNERYLKYKSAMRKCNILSSYQTTKTYQFLNDKRIFTENESIAYNDSTIWQLEEKIKYQSLKQYCIPHKKVSRQFFENYIAQQQQFNREEQYEAIEGFYDKNLYLDEIMQNIKESRKNIYN